MSRSCTRAYVEEYRWRLPATPRIMSPEAKECHSGGLSAYAEVKRVAKWAVSRVGSTTRANRSSYELILRSH